MRIRDPGWKNFGSGIREKSRIRDKHPGSATLMRAIRPSYNTMNAASKTLRHSQEVPVPYVLKPVPVIINDLDRRRMQNVKNAEPRTIIADPKLFPKPKKLQIYNNSFCIF